ncbi:hypothetical protein KY284_033097 [Solanum tuberosum]|nr:hypothetical protein KY284_033097 [Solanum tuberosum]
MANKKGPYLGLVIPNLFEMNPLLQHPSYKPSDLTIDYAGRRFRFGHIDNQPVVLVMTGLATLNAGITTQLLLALFDVKGVVHYGIAGNANPSLNIGDVAIPQYWAHTAIWNWQDRQHIFWVPVDPRYYAIANKLEGLKLEGCLNATTCLSHPSKVTRVHRGTSASIYLDNAAYRSFIYNKFDVSPVEMESAAVALICYQQKVPYIVIRALSDMAGGGTSESNEASTFITLAATNSVEVTVQFIKQLSSKKYQDA